MRVSNEPCTDRSSNARRELAHERAFDGLAVYGECRDSEQTLCVCEPVGMAHCVPAEATTIRKTAICMNRNDSDHLGVSLINISVALTALGIVDPQSVPEAIGSQTVNF